MVENYQTHPYPAFGGKQLDLDPPRGRYKIKRMAKGKVRLPFIVAQEIGTAYLDLIAEGIPVNPREAHGPSIKPNVIRGVRRSALTLRDEQVLEMPVGEQPNKFGCGYQC